MASRSLRQRTRSLAGVLACGLLGPGASPAAAAPNQAIDQQATYEVLVRRTASGVPHIKADDFASLGFGTGYAMAQDNVCILADQFLRFAAQRSERNTAHVLAVLWANLRAGHVGYVADNLLKVRWRHSAVLLRWIGGSLRRAIRSSN